MGTAIAAPADAPTTAEAAERAKVPARVCSVSLAGDELLALLIPAERVVCVTPYADDPAVSNVAQHYPASIHRVTARLEPVLDRAPDLVLAAPWNNGEFLRVIGETGVRVHVIESIADFEGMRRELRRLGALLGATDRAEQAITAMDRELDALAALRARERPRVLSFSHLVVAGEGTTVDALIRTAGGVNAAQEIGVRGHQKISAEAMIALDPDVLLLGFEDGTTVESVVAAYPELGLLRATREGRVVILPPRALTTVTPFLARAARELANAPGFAPAPARGAASAP